MSYGRWQHRGKDLCVAPLPRNRVVLNFEGVKQGRHKGIVLSGERLVGDWGKDRGD